MVILRRCRRMITLVPFGSRFEHLDQCKTQRVECFLERRRFNVMRNGTGVNYFYYAFFRGGGAAALCGFGHKVKLAHYWNQ